MNNKRNMIARNIITVIQALMVVALITFTYLFSKKMGVMRHVIYKNEIYGKGIFAPTNIKLVGIWLVVLLLIYLYGAYKTKGKHRFRNMISCFIAAAGVAYVFLNSVETTKTYYYGLFIFIGINILEFIKNMFLRDKTL